MRTGELFTNLLVAVLVDKTEANFVISQSKGILNN